jgi:hypothetical protein
VPPDTIGAPISARTEFVLAAIESVRAECRAFIIESPIYSKNRNADKNAGK